MRGLKGSWAHPFSGIRLESAPPSASRQVPSVEQTQGESVFNGGNQLIFRIKVDVDASGRNRTRFFPPGQMVSVGSLDTIVHHRGAAIPKKISAKQEIHKYHTLDNMWPIDATDMKCTGQSIGLLHLLSVHLTQYTFCVLHLVNIYRTGCKYCYQGEIYIYIYIIFMWLPRLGCLY